VLELLSKPLIERYDSGADCQPDGIADICTPCRQLDEYLPLLMVGEKAQAFKELAKAVLELDDLLMDAVCATPCLTWDTDDCQCLIDFGASIGVPAGYQTIVTNYCLVPYDSVKLSQCEDVLVKHYCDPVCAECVYVPLDCENEDDKAVYRKILKFKVDWFRKPATRENINAALVDWYGEGYVVGAQNGTIYWTLRRQATDDERAFMPFLYNLMPVSEFAELHYTEVL
jgi:hypothetical protein